MDERRKEERKKLMAFAPVFDARQGKVLGYLADLTLQGAMVIGEHDLEQGEKVELAIEFPSGMEPVFGRRMTVSARVTRCVPDKGPHSFKIGFEFEGLDADQAEMIRILLERYHISLHKGSTD